MSLPLFVLALVTGSFSIALGALFAFALIGGRRQSLRDLLGRDREALVFLFDGERLADATPVARQLIASAPGAGSDWRRLKSILAHRFPDLSARAAGLANAGELCLDARDGTGRIEAEWHDGIARIAVVSVAHETDDTRLDRHTIEAIERELETLRAHAEAAPFPAWRQDGSGTITWANRAYLDHLDQGIAETPLRPWPPALLFDTETTEPPGPWRQSMRHQPADLPPQWFDIHRIEIGTDALFMALPADAIVKAEKTLGEFVTTLTKTFAHLPIGLAIFDKSRRLVLFNPALTDLTLLPVEFLCAQPSLMGFLDQLREGRMLPEPKDYRSWRQHLSALEKSAVAGTYEETWTLPTGETYRVTGRPQPDGAVAFLFEDISAEVSLTRRFRAQLGLGQAAIDAVDEAIAVFSQGGVLALSNTAYDRLWGHDPRAAIGDFTFADTVSSWRDLCQPSPAWERLGQLSRSHGPRAPWSGAVSLRDGRTLACRFAPLGQGAFLVGFSHAQGAAPVPALLATAEG